MTGKNQTAVSLLINRAKKELKEKLEERGDA